MKKTLSLAELDSQTALELPRRDLMQVVIVFDDLIEISLRLKRSPSPSARMWACFNRRAMLFSVVMRLTSNAGTRQ